MPSISLVIPAYNEEAGIEPTFERCIATLRAVTDDWEIVFLDDCSQDRTYQIMETLVQRDPERIRAARHPVNQGIASTFQELYGMATKEFVFLIPADGEYPPEALRDCLPLLATHDIVLCRRQTKNYPWARRAISYGFRALPRLLFGVELYDPGTVKCMRREIFAAVPTTSSGVFSEAERLIRALKAGYTLGVVDIMQEARRGGVARGASPRLVREALGDLLALWIRLQIRRQDPLRADSPDGRAT